ncbi:hypothetical protein BCR35DRAFT_32729 [Leucosporidium creatinivorum]|uniref:F-box domain-containing protein n=1 Tax=Leucosporidium creatinivorum TaxID=106004 RepID=A0A1Y2FXV4_9BASI|nr:hypothetical protein BCR35DRAFT_32729 [Leucosporidium creatinivorum]
MASSVDSPAVARASIHSLPLELIQHIIKLAPPPLHSRTFHERYLILRRLALVNSSWSRFAQLELSRHISLDPKSYVALVKALSESSEPDHAGGTSQRRPREPWELAFRVETVRLKGMERPWLVKRVKGIMEYFPNVLELRVGHLMADPRSADCLGPSAFASCECLLLSCETL